MAAISDKELAEIGVEVNHYFISDEVYSKRTFIPAGTLLTKHAHDYDHASGLVSGKVVLTIDGAESILEGPMIVLVKAGSSHSVRAITDAVWHCIHLMSETDPLKIDAALMGEA